MNFLAVLIKSIPINFMNIITDFLHSEAVEDFYIEVIFPITLLLIFFAVAYGIFWVLRFLFKKILK